MAQDGLRKGQEKEKEAPPLSTSQLIIRRGLTTLAAVLVLAAGTAVHLTVPLPEVPYTNHTLDWENFTSPSQQSLTFEPGGPMTVI